jgi:hypothetical protein
MMAKTIDGWSGIIAPSNETNGILSIELPTGLTGLFYYSGRQMQEKFASFQKQIGIVRLILTPDL